MTTEDFEHLAREAAPEVARVRAVAAGDGADAGSVRVLVVPRRPHRRAGCGSTSSCRATRRSRRSPIASRRSRVIGTRAIVEPPVYRGVTVVAKLRARPRPEPDTAPGGGAPGAVRVLRPDRRRARRDRLAVRAAGQRRRGLLGPAEPARDGARRGRPAVRRRPGHRRARPADDRASSSSRTHSSSATSTRSWSRAPDAMRGTVDRLPNPHPLGPTLPAIYQEDDFAQRFMAALDDVLAPVIHTLDNLDCVSRSVSDAERLPELARDWVAISLDENWDDRAPPGGGCPGRRAVPAARYGGGPRPADRDLHRRDRRDRRERRDGLVDRPGRGAAGQRQAARRGPGPRGRPEGGRCGPARCARGRGEARARRAPSRDREGRRPQVRHMTERPTHT